MLKKKPKIWRTADGEEIPISEMPNAHLLNAILLKERSAAALKENMLSSIQAAVKNSPGMTPEVRSVVKVLVERVEEATPFEVLMCDPGYRALFREARARRIGAVPCGSWFHRGWTPKMPVDTSRGRIVRKRTGIAKGHAVREDARVPIRTVVGARRVSLIDLATTGTLYQYDPFDFMVGADKLAAHLLTTVLEKEGDLLGESIFDEDWDYEFDPEMGDH